MVVPRNLKSRNSESEPFKDTPKLFSEMRPLIHSEGFGLTNLDRKSKRILFLAQGETWTQKGGFEK